MSAEPTVPLSSMPIIDKLFIIRFFDTVVQQLDIDAEKRLASLSFEFEEDELMEYRIHEIREDLLPKIKNALDSNLTAFKEGASLSQAFSAGGMCVYVDKETSERMWPSIELPRRPAIEQPLGALVFFDFHYSLKFMETLRAFLERSGPRGHLVTQKALDKDLIYAAILKPCFPTHYAKLDLTRCTELSLSFQGIASIDDNLWTSMSCLKKLDLSSNQLMCINKKTFEGLDNLEVLNLNDEWISSIEDNSFAHMSRLISLDLTYNNLRRVNEKTFAGLNNLEWLSLSYNPLTLYHVNFNTFEHMPNLKELKILTNISIEGFNMSV